MLKKGIWFVLYIAGVTALAVSLLISILFFKEFDFSFDLFTSSNSYEHSEQVLADLRSEAEDIWAYYDFKMASEGVYIEASEAGAQTLLDMLYKMGYTDQEIYNALIVEITDEQVDRLAGLLGIDAELIKDLLYSHREEIVSNIEGAQYSLDIASVEGEDAMSEKQRVAAINSYDAGSTNVRYTIQYNGEMLDDNLPDESADDYTSHTYLEERDGMELRVFLNTTYPVSDTFSYRAFTYNQFQNLKWILIGTVVGSLLFIIASVVALSCYTGRKKGRAEIVLSWIDIPPVEIAVVFWGSVAAGLIVAMLTMGSWCYDTQSYMSLGAFAGCALLTGCLSMTGYLSLVRRLKSHTFLKNSICYKVGSAIGRLVKSIMRIPSVSQKLLILVGIYLGAMIVLAVIGGRGSLVIMTLLSVLAFVFIYRDAVSRQHILEAAKRITSGELDYQINLEEINDMQMDVAQSINQVGHGIQKAVQKSIKDERLRTDLITNVSHDIKTPLTSIINYVDLLKREDIQNEKAKGYLDILEQKSQRLKQLTEDLVEASKLSSGNVVLDLEKMDFNEILQQALGEFEEKFQERSLQVILKRPEGQVAVLAEGRRMWRILENLFQNVYKYAMPATRVYVTLEKYEDHMIFTLKNISEYSLNVEADELTERFIRGDVARSTEGSGLGLSIAKNLTTLQKGDFHIHLDGDLFKVTLRFDLIV